MAITTDSIKSVVEEVLVDEANARSAISLVSESKISADTDVITTVDHVSGGIVGEGQKVVATEPTISHHNVISVPLRSMFVMTREAEQKADKRLLEALINGAINTFTIQSDMAVFYGTNIETGNAYAPLNGVNLYTNGKKEQQGPSESILELTAKVIKESDDAESIIFTKAGASALATHGINGSYPYANYKNNEVFTYMAIQGLMAPNAGYKKYVPAQKVATDALAFVGNFNNVERALGNIDVRRFDQATFGTTNLAEENKIAYQVSALLKLAVVRPGEFVVVKKHG